MVTSNSNAVAIRFIRCKLRMRSVSIPACLAFFASTTKAFCTLFVGDVAVGLGSEAGGAESEGVGSGGMGSEARLEELTRVTLYREVGPL